MTLSTFFFFLMIRRPPRSTLSSSSAASDVYKRQEFGTKSQTARVIEQQEKEDELQAQGGHDGINAEYGDLWRFADIPPPNLHDECNYGHRSPSFDPDLASRPPFG
eukprot:TRINITY_DN826_c0_g1_i20.p4 TRINITY_DN826_c0_g1~~TRINITY_DN826_c0_g1_i20.p4  ORF type:complete len:106 (-),score=27.58 TRINITY_DN826_c0_g1_i20:1124-1441(-)